MTNEPPARADFYLIDKPRFRDRPLLLVCALVAKAHAAGQPCLILAGSMAQAEELDDLLWDFEPEAFIPHQIAEQSGPEADDEVPVLIVPPGVIPAERPLLLNLREEPVSGNFKRVLEIVPADQSARSGSRQRWQQYRQRGMALQKHDM